ncbi:uncharacterized protein MYCFIDRAFT_171463 [Pseudocercospora fijiensis CIRAD86]|uniref:F-box domain-containing protein n=1 Tax=Pseudocercospora fijiensis (strain CIRAD86) TaxID=383855 RepID=M3ALT3_PSEFD|nr:uncharacterized protein MYCFIDRAFT_171463 [Pseudocercospora fijiensis CIRAD86]EME85556.1 hypothetical protein MYCFIDRAFT_171463 [Pseudocercospora fijiensis CIRAD86]
MDPRKKGKTTRKAADCCAAGALVSITQPPDILTGALLRALLRLFEASPELMTAYRASSCGQWLGTQVTADEGGQARNERPLRGYGYGYAQDAQDCGLHEAANPMASPRCILLTRDVVTVTLAACMVGQSTRMPCIFLPSVLAPNLARLCIMFYNGHSSQPCIMSRFAGRPRQPMTANNKAVRCKSQTSTHQSLIHSHAFEIAASYGNTNDDAPLLAWFCCFGTNLGCSLSSLSEGMSQKRHWGGGGGGVVAKSKAEALIGCILYELAGRTNSASEKDSPRQTATTKNRDDDEDRTATSTSTRNDERPATTSDLQRLATCNDQRPRLATYDLDHRPTTTNDLQRLRARGAAYKHILTGNHNPTKIRGHESSYRQLMLEDLPPELLGNILEFIDTPPFVQELPPCIDAQKRLRELCRTSLVSKAFCEATQPCLYRVIDITPLRKPNIRKFLRTLWGNPALARFFQDLSLGEHVMRAKEAPSQEELRSHAALLNTIGNQDLEVEIMESLMQGCPTAQNALILALATNVRLLDLTLADPIRQNRVKLGYVQGLCTCCPNMAQCLGSILARDSWSFGNLRTLTLRSSPEQIQCTTYDIQRQLWRLPLLEEVVLSKFCTSSSTGTISLPSKSTIRKIVLDHCTVDSGSIAYMIQACKALTEFEVLCPSGRIDAEEFLTALKEHSAHLESLTIKTLWKNRPLFQDNKPIGSLSAFKSMHFLELDSDMLTGTHRWGSDSLSLPDLPPSIKCLKVKIRNNLSELVPVLRSLQPKLSPSLDLLKVTFPCDSLLNREYLDVIQEEDMWEKPEAAEVRLDRGWSITLSHTSGGSGLCFSCWKDKKSVKDKIWPLAEQIMNVGVRKLLEEYYANCVFDENFRLDVFKESLWSLPPTAEI